MRERERQTDRGKQEHLGGRERGSRGEEGVLMVVVAAVVGLSHHPSSERVGFVSIGAIPDGRAIAVVQGREGGELVECSNHPLVLGVVPQKTAGKRTQR